MNVFKSIFRPFIIYRCDSLETSQKQRNKFEGKKLIEEVESETNIKESNWKFNSFLNLWHN